MTEGQRPDDFRGNQPRRTLELVDWQAQVAAAPAIEPAMPIVDAHHHLFGTRGDALFYRLEDLQRDLDLGHRIIGTVYIEAYESGWRKTGPEALRPVGEVEMIAALSSVPTPTASGACQVAAAIVCHADLMLGDGVAQVLDAQLAVAQGRLRGLRHRTATVGGAVALATKDQRKPHLMTDPAFRRGFAQLAARGLSFDAWVYHPQLGELIDLADAFPDTTIVVDHVGGLIGVAEFRSRRADVLRQWEAGVRALAARPNVRMKLGGMGMPLFGFGFEHRDRPASAAELAQAWRPLIETCVDAFGAGRCMFESNFPVDKQSCNYGELWNAFKLVTRGWSPHERADLFYRSACRTYRLPDLESLGDHLQSQ